jgi:glycosyltransferase 2 family protein
MEPMAVMQPRSASQILRRHAGPLVGIVASLGFTLLFLRGGGLTDGASAIGSLSVAALAVGLAAVAANLVLSALRWRFLLRAAGVQAPASRLFAAMASAAAMNNIVPARGGDALRIVALRQVSDAPGFAVAGTLFAERLLDGLVLAAWIVLGALMLGQTGPLLLTGLALLGGTSIGVALVAFAAARPASARRAAARLASHLPERLGGRLERATESFVSGLAVFRRPGPLAAAVGASIAMWLADVVMYAAVARGVGLPVPVGGYFLLEGIGNLALAVPGTAGGAGSFDYLTLVGTRSAGFAGGAVAGYVLAVHALTVLPPTLIGLATMRFALPGRRRAEAPAPVEVQLPAAGACQRAGARHRPAAPRHLPAPRRALAWSPPRGARGAVRHATAG